MKKVFRLIIVGMSLVIGTAFLMSPCIAAEISKPITLNYATFVAANSWHGQIHQWWANEVEKRTQGKVKIKPYWMESLIKVKDALPGVKSGMAELAWVGSTYHPSNLRIFMVTDSPFNFGEDYAAAMLALIDTYENEPNLKAELEKENIIQVATHIAGQGEIGCKDRVNSLADLKGKTVRTYGGARVKYKSNLGANPVFMSYAEIYEAVDRGTIFGYGFNLLLSTGFKHYEVTKSILMVNSGGSLASGIFMNRKVFNGLPQDIQKVFLTLRKDYSIHFAEKLKADEVNVYREWETKHGVKLVKLTPEEQKVNIKAGNDATEDLLKKEESEGNAASRKVWEYFTKARKKYEAQRAKTK